MAVVKAAEGVGEREREEMQTMRSLQLTVKLNCSLESGPGHKKIRQLELMHSLPSLSLSATPLNLAISPAHITCAN